jgi:MGT family glycosyltransferase
VPARAVEPLPNWWRVSRPLVYLSFGSAAAGNGFFPDLYRDAAEALRELDANVLLTLGTQVDPAALGPVPENVHVERWVPQGQVMPQAAAMIGHGGSGSTLAAMAAGVPMALIPLFADQPQNAHRVARLGAGVALDGVDGLAGIVRRLLDDPRYWLAAQRVHSEIASLAPVEHVVPLLRDLAQGEAMAA